MRYLKLSEGDVDVLENLYNHSPNNTVRKRSQCLLLSHRRQKITDLASIFKVSRRTIERWFDGWEKVGVDSLSIAEGRGAKTILKDYTKEVSQQLELHNRNLKNVLAYFDQQYGIVISKKTLQNFLKINGL